MSMIRAAAYERLSREDDRSNESTSIESQKMIIESYAKAHGFRIIVHYSDDGFTGSNFHRPAFQQLIQAIEKKAINCVIVKDLSRLGRELYETGSYIEAYFLSKNIRFIAINDGYDSLQGDLMLGIRLSVNDMYLRDTSKKIRSSLDIRRKKGEYIANYAKYGYKKDPQDSKKLIIDPITAPIVQQIFQWASQGLGSTIIAQRLTEQAIPIPSIYKKENRHYTTINGNEKGIWRAQTIRNILQDEMYLGHMVQGRWKKASYRSKKLIATSPDEWFVVYHTHPPIISQALFDRVQETLRRQQRYRSNGKKKYLLQGLLFCQDCGHRLTIRERQTKNGPHHFAECSFYSKYSKYGGCSSHRIDYDALEREVLRTLQEAGQNLFSGLGEAYFLKLGQKAVQDDEFSEKRWEQEKAKIHNKIRQLYEDRLDGIIQLDQYQWMAQKFEKQLEDIEAQLHACKHMTSTNPELSLMSTIRSIVCFEHPSSALLFQLIEKMIVSQDKTITVVFRVDLRPFLTGSPVHRDTCDREESNNNA